MFFLKDIDAGTVITNCPVELAEVGLDAVQRCFKTVEPSIDRIESFSDAIFESLKIAMVQQNAHEDNGDGNGKRPEIMHG